MVFRLTEMKATETSNRYLTMHKENSDGCSYKDGLLVVMGPARNVGVYTQHHCWLLFSVLTLSMAHVVNRNTSGGTLIGFRAGWEWNGGVCELGGERGYPGWGQHGVYCLLGTVSSGIWERYVYCWIGCSVIRGTEARCCRSIIR